MEDSANTPDEPPGEPVFVAVAQADSEMREAYAKAADSVPRFIEHLEGGDYAYAAAKLRFRDPDESERLGEDQFLFLWLGEVYYHEDEALFSGVFFELPDALTKWHQVGERLGFDAEDMFDWMVLTDEGALFGGFTLRVARSRLPESQLADYDAYVGVRTYAPIT